MLKRFKNITIISTVDEGILRRLECTRGERERGWYTLESEDGGERVITGTCMPARVLSTGILAVKSGGRLFQFAISRFILAVIRSLSHAEQVLASLNIRVNSWSILLCVC